MQVHYPTILKALGCQLVDGPPGTQQRCPLHPNDGTTLTVRQHQVTGEWRFVCTTPQCPASGDIFTLVSLARGIELKDTIALFKPGGMLHHAVLDSPPIEEFDDYLALQQAESRVRTYLAKCHMALKQSPDGIHLRQAIYQGETRSIPRAVGMLLPNEIPPELREFGKNKYKQERYLIYTYSYEGHVTKVQVHAPLMQGHNGITIKLSDNDIGMFMEDCFPPDAKQVFIAQSPQAAFKLRANRLKRTNLIPPTIVLTGYALPPDYQNLQDVVLVHTQDAPLTLDTALALHAVEAFVPGIAVDSQPKFFVVDIKVHGAPDVYLDPRKGNARPSLRYWIIKQIIAAIEKEQTADVYQALNSVGLSEARKDELIKQARKMTMECSDDVIELLEQGAILDSNRFDLANGRTVLRTPTGFRGISKNGKRKQLSNTIFTVKRRIRARNGTMINACHLRNGNNPIIEANIPTSAFHTADKLKQAIASAFEAAGHSAYVAFYDTPGYRWDDILTCSSASCPLVTEVSQLGVDDELTVHLPNVCLNVVEAEVVPQERIFTLPPMVHAAYQGLIYVPQVEVKHSLRLLLQQADNMYAGALALGLGHIIHQLRSAMACVIDGHSFKPLNLIYVETEQGIWGKTIQQLMQILSNTDYPPALPQHQTLKTLEGMEAIGSLPLIASFGNLRKDLLLTAVADSPIGLIAALDSMSAADLAGDATTSFVVPTSGSRTDSSEIDPLLLYDIKMSLPGFLLEVLLKDKVNVGYKTHELPGLMGYLDACDTVEIEPNPMVERLIRAYYTGVGFTSIHAFFAELHGLLYGTRSTPIKMLHGLPKPGSTPPLICNLNNQMLVSKSIVEMINRRSRINMFRTQLLDDDLHGENLLAEPPDGVTIDTTRYWVLDIKTWSKYVKRDSLILKQPVRATKPLQLAKVS